MPNIKPPEPPNSYPDVEQVRDAFFASRHSDWRSFCDEMNWNANSSRMKFPVAVWVAEKRRSIAESHIDEIKSTVFEHRINYRKDVLRTLRDYPATADAIHHLIRMRVNQMADKLEKNPNATETVIIKGNAVEVPLLDSEELVKLSLAMKTITDSKYKALLLSDVVARVAAEAPAKIDVDEQDTENVQKSQGFSLQIIGMGEVSLKDLQRLTAEYLDPPQAPALPALSSALGQGEKTEPDPFAELMKEDPPLVETPR